MSTPMLQQYEELKRQYPDCILLFRLGDFYEGFDEDAKTLSKVLGITLTGRGKDQNRKAMAGIPYHALNQYLPKLVRANLKVAICEQLEEPKPGQIVKRDVVKVITAGTLLDQNILDAADNNYLVSIYAKKSQKQISWGLSFADLSTGEFKLCEFYNTDIRTIPKELQLELFRLRPAEIVLPKELVTVFKQVFNHLSIEVKDDLDYNYNQALTSLLELFQVSSLKGFGIDNYQTAITAAGMLYKYLLQTQKHNITHLHKISLYKHYEYMQLDQATIRNLELIYPLQVSSQGKTLYDVLNHCCTPMGQRLLRSWILRPLINKEQIIARHDQVAELFGMAKLRTKLSTQLSQIIDMERVLSRIASQNANARDLLFFKTSLCSALEILNLIAQSKIKYLAAFINDYQQLSTLQSQVVELIDISIKDDPAVTITEGNIIKSGYSKELDAIKLAETEGKDFVRNLQASEIKRTGISSLKVRFNKVFGYYIEISKSNLDKVPASYIRKQTLVNGERFITAELKQWEEKILGAEAKAAEMEYQIFEKIKQQLLTQLPLLQNLINKISQIDLLTNFANLAEKYNYVRPQIFDDPTLTSQIEAGRHPVVEQFSSDQFVANHTSFETQQKQILILTGPNMSGKSTYIRQVALLFLMAQIGSFIPAQSAKLVIADRIFTRVGASDNLAGGESTFMVEMNETANILNNATASSLIILDEIGRGTSTYDGVAIAWAIVEYLAQNIKARTLFATHYHELIELQNKFANVHNLNVKVTESEGKVLFLRTIEDGATDKSYGIHVAQIAGIPKSVIQSANKILQELENQTISTSSSLGSPEQLDFVDFIQQRSDSKIDQELQILDIENMSPLEALIKLHELKNKAQNGS